MKPWLTFWHLHITTSIFVSVCLTFVLCLVCAARCASASTVVCVALTCERNTGDAPHHVPVFLLMFFSREMAFAQGSLGGKRNCNTTCFWLGIYITLYGPYTSSFILPAKIVKEWIHNDVYDAFFIKYLYHWPPLQFHPSLGLGSITNDGWPFIHHQQRWMILNDGWSLTMDIHC